MMKNLFFYMLFLSGILSANAQFAVDSCFTSLSPGTSFTGGTNLWGQDSDLLQWNGSSWTGGWPGANLTIPPAIGGVGCRAIFCGNSSSWTSGGEVFGYRLTAPLIAGTTYSIPFTYVSHGTGSTGSFAPYIYTNSSGSMTGAFSMGTLPAVGYTWTTNTFTFTAAAGQNGHTWIIIGTKPSGTSGLISSFCCDVTAPCNVNLGPDQSICQGQTVTLNATTAGATYIWSTGATSATIPVTVSGSYWVQITVGACTDRDTVVVTVNPNPTVNLGADQSICQGQTYTFNATTTGATYLWSNSATTPTISPGVSGNYAVTVTVNGCTGTDNVNLTVNPNPTVNLGADQSICQGQTYTFNATTTGATYLWSNSATTPTISPGVSGNYAVTVTVNGCTGTDNVNLTVNPNPTVNLGADQTICQGQTYTFNATTTGATYLWSNSATTPTISPGVSGNYAVTVTVNGCTGTDNVNLTVNPSPSIDLGADQSICQGQTFTFDATTTGATYLWSTSETTPTISTGTTGTYMVTVTLNGCTDTDDVSLTVNSNPSLSLSGNDATCGSSDGNATATPSSGTAPFYYEWNSTPVQTTQTMTNVPAGNYTVTVTDDNGCTATASIIINNIGGPSVVTSFTTAVCGQANGSATVTATGGSGTYTYIWSTTPVQNTQTATGLTAGTYTVTVDDGVCTAIGSVVVPDSVFIIQVSITSVIDASCGNPTGSATANATNGTAPHSYEWNSSPVQTGSTLLNVVGGTYIVTVTDAGGCSGTASVTIQDTPGPSLAVSSTPETCDQGNGTASVSVSGGSGVYSYTWSSGDTTALISGLISGNYSVTVDDGGCTASATVTVSSTPGPIASFTAHPTIVTLMDGAVNFNDQSIGNIVFWDWDFGDGSPHGTGSQTSHIYSETGEYIVILIVTDANGCTDTTSSTIYVRENLTIYIPNSFSPNGDGLNDVFSPYGLNVDPNDFEMYIFNRWGELIYYTTVWGITTAEEPWNGTYNNTGSHKEALMDVYVYRIIIKEIDGKKNQHIGIITLIK